MPNPAFLLALLACAFGAEEPVPPSLRLPALVAQEPAQARQRELAAEAEVVGARIGQNGRLRKAAGDLAGASSFVGVLPCGDALGLPLYGAPTGAAGLCEARLAILSVGFPSGLAKWEVRRLDGGSGSGGKTSFRGAFFRQGNSLSLWVQPRQSGAFSLFWDPARGALSDLEGRPLLSVEE